MTSAVPCEKSRAPRWLRDPRTRRAVALLALVAFVLLVAISAAHVGEKGDGHDDRCSTCFAAAAIGTSESFAAPILLARLAHSAPPPHTESTFLAATDRCRSHAPRDPPSRA